MADFRLKVATPERVLYDGAVKQVSLPTPMGEITILPNHIPLVSVVSPGELRITADKQEVPLAVSQGVVEISNNTITVLADTAERVRKSTCNVQSLRRPALNKQWPSVSVIRNTPPLPVHWNDTWSALDSPKVSTPRPARHHAGRHALAKKSRYNRLMGVIPDTLNPEQDKAVKHGDGPLLIVAGAGDGQTTVSHRAVGLVIMERKLRPENILGFTFTDKAAGEMEDRVDRLLPFWVFGRCGFSTFHNFGERVLKTLRARYWPYLGF